MKKLMSVDYNWFYSQEVGEEYSNYSLSGDTINLVYHSPSKNDNQHYVDVTFKSGKIKRIFNINKLTFSSEEIK